MVGEIIKAVILGAGKGLAEGIMIALGAMFALLAVIAFGAFVINIIIIIYAYKNVKGRKFWFVPGAFLLSVLFAFWFNSFFWYVLSPISVYAVYKLLKKKKKKPQI